MVPRPNLGSNSIFIPSTPIHQPRRTPPKQAMCSRRTHLRQTLSSPILATPLPQYKFFVSLLFQQWYCHNTNFSLSFIFGYGQSVKGRKMSSNNCDSSIAQFAFFSPSPLVTSFSLPSPTFFYKLSNTITEFHLSSCVKKLWTIHISQINSDLTNI